MPNLISRAAAYAAVAHGKIDQRRKYTNEPYITHPFHVAELVASTGARPEVIAAAWLHDVVEDTPVTIQDIKAEFGSDVADLVAMVTDVSTRADGNRATRKEKDRQHLAKASAEGQTIKLADLIHNTSTITLFDPEFAKVYLREKAALLDVLHEGAEGLMQIARRQLLGDSEDLSYQ